MDIHSCLKILELDHTASMADVNQAYKDIVNVWHPDRFTYNPRLQRKAEEKIKEINLAYAILKTFYARKQVTEPERKGSRLATDTGKGTSSREKETRDKTEAAFELGTQLVLSTWSYLSSRLRRMIDTQVINREEEHQKQGKAQKQDLT
jgi:curved DNA-binding protein CbpA